MVSLVECAAGCVCEWMWVGGAEWAEVGWVWVWVWEGWGVRLGACHWREVFFTLEVALRM